MTTIYMYAEYPSGRTTIRIGGNLRPDTDILREAKDCADALYDEELAIEAITERIKSLPQDRDIEDFHGCHLRIGKATVNTTTGAIEVQDRDSYEFYYSDLNLIGRKPRNCDKGYADDPNNFLSPTDPKPDEWEFLA